MLARVALTGGLCALLFGAAAASAAADVSFTIVNPSGTPQYGYYLVLPSSSEPPTAIDWQYATPMSTPGQATVTVAAGRTVYFSRTVDVYDRNGTLVPPEGVTGQAYAVTAATPPDVTVTLPSTGSAYHPELSGSERWLLGEINQQRVGAGAPALELSTTLDAAASEEARDEAVNHRWPDPYFFAINQDFGWPGDIPTEDYATADAPFSDPQRVLTHWDGDPSDSESPAIWHALSDPTLKYAGIADGAGAWIINATDSCPDLGDLAACGLTTDTGDVGAWSPTQITITAPASGVSFAPGQSAAAQYTCSAPAAGAPVAACAGTVASGQPIDTSGTGTRTFTVTATDVNGDTTTQSAQYSVQAPATPPSSTSPPQLSGVAKEGQALAGTAGGWSGTVDHYDFKWLRCHDATTADCQTVHATDGSGPSDATDSYTLQAADDGSYMILQVYAVDGTGNGPSARSSAVGPIAKPGTPPSNLTRPGVSLSGAEAQPGARFVASPGTWSG
ncbi:MAG: hypothetical protein ACRDNS_12710, partial [Trebonia sp.]